MASIVLTGVGALAGGAIGGSFLGVSAVSIGAAVGGLIGSAIDSQLFAADQASIEGRRLEALRVTSSTEGAVIPHVSGRMRIGGNVIWATDYREERKENSSGGITLIDYHYHASFAIALCEGPISGIGRIWVDGDLMDTTNVVMRVYTGTEDQMPDAFIEAKMGTGEVPAYRGIAYVIFEDLDVTNYGSRIPQLSFEVFRTNSDATALEAQARGVALLPGTGEFALATTEVRAGTEGQTTTENKHADPAKTDLVVALDRMEVSLPDVENVSLLVSWFGTDLRAGNCEIKPGVESTTKIVSPPEAMWLVGLYTRDISYQISTDQNGDLAYGGTPSDVSVKEAIAEITARGKAVTYYPLILMDIASTNALPDPYSDNAATTGQPAYPWRGRITGSPATGYIGAADGTAAAADQVAAFFGNVQISDFAIFPIPDPGGSVFYLGDVSDWGYRRFILHQAFLCSVSGGVDSFILGSELPGLMQLRDETGAYPAVAAMRQLAADVSSILPFADIGYAADWSEYFGHQPNDGTGDVIFNLDPLWADPNIDFVGIDNYLPLSDWRDGTDHLDARAGWPSIYDTGYLQSGIEGGEYYDWFYASDADRAAQTRTPIADGAYGKPWVFRAKDFRTWWSQPHYDRPGGVEAANPTEWVPQSKPIRFTELGCAAIDRGSNQPNVFYDPKSSESALPHDSRGWRDDVIQRRYLEVMLAYWSDAANNPPSTQYAGQMVDMSRAALWAWDARPFPDFPARDDIWGDSANWQVGHWLSGRVGAAPLAALVRDLCVRGGMSADQLDTTALWQVVSGDAITAIESPRTSLTALMKFFSIDAVEAGGRIVFRPRDRLSVATLAPDDMVVTSDGAEPFELKRAQSTELPQSLDWNVVRPDDGSYDPASVEARRPTSTGQGVVSETFAFAVTLEEADRRCRTGLMEAWVGIDTLNCALPPSRLGLIASDIIKLNYDGRDVSFRLGEVSDGEYRAISAVRHDETIYDLPPGAPRAAKLQGVATFGAPLVAFADIPKISEGDTDYRPYAAAYARPWPGQLAIWRSASSDNFEVLDTISAPASFGVLVDDLAPGPVWRFDNGNALLIDLSSGTPNSVPDTDLFNGANYAAVESATGIWEVLQYGTAELVSTGRYRLSHLLRGQRGTEAAIGAAVGARVLLLDDTVRQLPIAQGDVGREWQWRIGPATGAASDVINTALTYTPAGRGLEPFSPAQMRMRRDSATLDIDISWVRRDRDLAADSWELVITPGSEDTTQFDLEILSADGVNVLRTVNGLLLQSYTYTAAMQTADFGGVVGGMLRARIYQTGALGRGAPLEQTISKMERT